MIPVIGYLEAVVWRFDAGAGYGRYLPAAREASVLGPLARLAASRAPRGVLLGELGLDVVRHLLVAVELERKLARAT